MDQTLGSKGFLKRSEFIRLITDALNTLGFDEIGTLLEEKSGIPLHSETMKQFLKQIKDGEWDKSIDTLQQLGLNDQNPAKYLLLEQKYYEALHAQDQGSHAIQILQTEIMPLGVNTANGLKLVMKLLCGPGEDRPSRSEVLEKLQKMFPPGVIITEKWLEHLLEDCLNRQVKCCTYHNIPDNELSLCAHDHDCNATNKIPSKTLQILEAHTDEVLFLEFSHNGKYLASSSKDRSAIIWELNADKRFVHKYLLIGHEKTVVSVLWRPDDTEVITCGEEEVIRRYDMETGAFIRSYEINGVGSISCGWFHDSLGVIGGMADKRIYLWNLDGSEVPHEQEQRAQKLSDVAMSNDGKWIISVGKENEMVLFNRETRGLVVFKEEDMITSFSISSDNKYLLVNLITAKINVWNIEKEPIKVVELEGHKRTRFIIRSCFGGYNNSFVASGSEDSHVYIWNRVRNEETYRELEGHAGAVNCVSWNPTDIHMLASASDDRTIRIWGLP